MSEIFVFGPLPTITSSSCGKSITSSELCTDLKIQLRTTAMAKHTR
jgi:hypothetical protein